MRSNATHFYELMKYSSDFKKNDSLFFDLFVNSTLVRQNFRVANDPAIQESWMPFEFCQFASGYIGDRRTYQPCPEIFKVATSYGVCHSFNARRVRLLLF
jgi:hypothetical protein